ncbi:MAG: lysozyme [Rhizomicrobium sp.]
MSNWPDEASVFALAAPLIEQFEGFRAAPYRDSVGVATIGYGTIQYPDGKAVTMSDPAVTQAQAGEYLSYQMQLKAAALGPLLQKPATLHQAAAMLSLAYNIGTGAFQSSTVLRKFNAGDPAGAADAFLMWDKGTVNGKKVVIDGLHKRRVAERTIFLTAD